MLHGVKLTFTSFTKIRDREKCIGNVGLSLYLTLFRTSGLPLKESRGCSQNVQIIIFFREC